MNKTRDAAFKAKVAFEAATGQKTIVAIASEYGVHTTQIGQLKVELEWLKKKSQTLQLRRNGH